MFCKPRNVQVKAIGYILCALFYVSCSARYSSGIKGDKSNVDEKRLPVIPSPVLVIAGEDEVATAGDTLSVLVRLPDSLIDTSTLFLQSYTYTADNSTPVVAVYEIPSSSHVSGRGTDALPQAVDLIIPPNAAWMNLSFVGYSGVRADLGELSFPVVDRSGAPQENASLYALASRYLGDTSLNYYDIERQSHPDNAVAFVVKWDVLLQRGIASPAVIRADLKQLDSCPASAGKTLALFIAHVLLQDGLTERYAEELQALRDDPVFNHALVTEPLRNAIDIYVQSHPSAKGMPEVICANNPESLFTEFRLSGREWKVWAVATLNAICMRRLANREEPQTLYALLRALLDSNGSVSHIMVTAQRLEAALANKTQVVFLSDPYRNSYAARGKMLMAVAEAYRRSERGREAENVLQELLATLPAGNPNRALANKAMAQLLIDRGYRDSALIRLQCAYQDAQQVPLIQDSVFTDVLELVKDSGTARLILTSNGTGRAILPKLSADVPPVVLPDKIIPLTAPGQDVILEFFSKNCSPCNANLRALARQEKAGRLRDVLVVVVSRDSEPAVRQIQNSLGVEFPVAQNGALLCNYFNVSSTPVTVRVTASGHQLYRVEGGGDADFRF